MFLLVSLPSNLWDTQLSGSPHHPCMTRSCHTSFAPVSHRVYRTRYVAVASFSDSSLWHPFRSAIVTNASYHAHVNIFIKLHILAYVIRIMITTFKCLK